VPRRNIDDIREKIRLGKYDMTVHAVEEMAEDGLDILDFEQSILYGQISRIEKRIREEQSSSLKVLRLKSKYQWEASAVLLTTGI